MAHSNDDVCLATAHRPKDEQQDIFTWVWTCHYCKVQGGMTVYIETCPDCSHSRCLDCPTERHEYFAHRDSGLLEVSNLDCVPPKRSLADDSLADDEAYVLHYPAIYIPELREK